MISRALFVGLLLLTMAGASGTASAETGVRVATWNVEEVGEPGSSQYEAARDVLQRIGADVVAVNEVRDHADAECLGSLARASGYPHYYVAPAGPLGEVRNAMLSVYPWREVGVISSVELSGDSRANDLTRYFIEARIDLPGPARDLIVVGNHWKASWEDANEFRRAVESMRCDQILAGYDAVRDAYVVVGDVNEEVEDLPLSPASFYSLPYGLPQTYWLGDDLYDWMRDEGIDNDPFQYLTQRAELVNALQVDGADYTFPGSRRRLDYLLVSDALMAGGVASEVYDSADEWRDGGLPKEGDPLGASVSATASDHLLVFADLLVPDAGPIVLPPNRKLGFWRGH